VIGMRLFSRGAVHVGATQSYVQYVLPFACSARYQHGTGIRVGLTVGPTTLTIPAIAHGKLNLVIAGEREATEAGLARELLYDGEVLIVSALDRWPTPVCDVTLGICKRPVFAFYKNSGPLSSAARRLIDDLKALAVERAKSDRIVCEAPRHDRLRPWSSTTVPRGGRT
jgi:hypothetical protein